MSGSDDTASGRVDRLAQLGEAGETPAAYAAAAPHYTADHMGRGFILPFVGAGVLAKHLGPDGGSVLDAGCGTGLVGAALSAMGIGPIAGADFSMQMLGAAAETGAYGALVCADLSQRLPFEDRFFDGVIATGVFGPGHAPPSALYELRRVAGFGCPIVFSVREDTFREQGFPAVIDELTATGGWRPLEEGEPFSVYLLDKPGLMGRVFAFRAA